MFLTSLAPVERERQLQSFKAVAQRTGKSPAAYFTAISAKGIAKAEGLRILGQQVIADDKVILRISVRGTEPGKELVAVDAKMIKIGNEWKAESIGNP